MISTKEVYTILCNECGADFSEQDQNQYEDVSLLEDIATDEGWVKKEGFYHLCPECYEKTH